MLYLGREKRNLGGVERLAQWLAEPQEENMKAHVLNLLRLIWWPGKRYPSGHSVYKDVHWYMVRCYGEHILTSVPRVKQLVDYALVLVCVSAA